jgi:GalNAc5-diNAcBac-PP-undecaprenol beta-1,3-glucosyltransferase
MNKYPKLSIVIPTYNRSSYLKECLDSIINQNYPNLEIIITDDNSTDDTEKISKNYIKKYPFIKYVKNKKYLQGPNGNKNNGLDFCTGEIISIFDDDDTMVENSLTMMVDKLLEGYDIVIANCRIVSNRYDNGDFSGKGLNESKEIDWRDFFCGKISGEFFSIFKRGILGNKRFDTDLYGGEGTLWRGMLKNGKIYYIHKAVRNYRINDTSVSHKTIEKADIVIKNYERDIEYYGKEMKKYCPCYLATIYKGASYFAKLSSQYKKGFRYLIDSIKLCPKYKGSYIMLIAMFLPKQLIPYLSKIRVLIKRILK